MNSSEKKSKSSVQEYFENNRGAGAGLSTTELQRELNLRAIKNVFPFEVFHPNAQVLMTMIHTHFDIPRSFIGLITLSVYSSAIGTAYAVRRGDSLAYMAIWGCMEGMSSSGKSLPMDLLLEPLWELQKEFDQNWKNYERQSMDSGKEEELKRLQMKMVIFRDCHVPTLVRSVLPDNPKGVTKDAEEILEWINGLNSLSRNEGIDEQFYMSGWGVKSYSGIRSGKVRFIIPRVFINIIGGIQPDVTWKLFKNDRDTTGFIFRLLFAPIDEQRIALAENDFMIPNEIKSQHRRVIRELFNGLPVEDGYQQPKVLIMSAEAKKLHQNWHRNHAHNINGISDERTRNIKAGILGKMAEYAIRFCGLLCVSDMSYENQPFLDSFEMDVKYMERAIKLADYFYESAWTVYSRVVKQVTAPVEVLRYAGYVRAGWSNARIGDTEFPGVKSPEARRKRAARILIKMVADYPKVFGANAKT